FKQEEILFIIEGLYEVTVGDETAKAGPGSIVFIPRNVVHRFKNVGSITGRMLGWSLPGGRDSASTQLPRLALVRFRRLRDAHVGTSHAPHLGNRVVQQIDRRMSFANGLLIWTGHETKGFAVLQIHMRGMTESTELLGGLLKRGELLEELFFSKRLRRETAFGLVVGIHEVLHVDAPVAGVVIADETGRYAPACSATNAFSRSRCGCRTSARPANVVSGVTVVCMRDHSGSEATI